MDPVTLTLVGATLGAVALVACLIPASAPFGSSRCRRYAVTS
jgi:hypothetical protein